MKNTREFGHFMQQGCRDSEKWEFGPFFAARTELALGVVWGAGVVIGSWTFQIGATQRTS